MVSSEEIIERSFYMALLHTAVKNNLTLDPDKYLTESGNPTPESLTRYQEDKENMEKFIYIFGIGNNQSRGIKEVPRITLDLQGYYPGHIGIEKFSVDKSDPENPKQITFADYATRDIIIDVRLVANTQKDMRLLHNIMYQSLPAIGYIKPYLNDPEEYDQGKVSSTDNIFIEVGNYYDHNDLNQGILERVYSYKVSDGVVETFEPDVDLVPIKDISVLLSPDLGFENNNGVNVQVP